MYSDNIRELIRVFDGVILWINGCPMLDLWGVTGSCLISLQDSKVVLESALTRDERLFINQYLKG